MWSQCQAGASGAGRRPGRTFNTRKSDDRISILFCEPIDLEFVIVGELCWALDLIDSFSGMEMHSGIGMDCAARRPPVTHITAGPGGLAGHRSIVTGAARPSTPPTLPRARSVAHRRRKSRLGTRHPSSNTPDRRFTIVTSAHIAHQKSTWPHIPGRDPTGLNISGRYRSDARAGSTSEGLVTQQGSRSAFPGAISNCRLLGNLRKRRIPQLGARIEDLAPLYRTRRRQIPLPSIENRRRVALATSGGAAAPARDHTRHGRVGAQRNSSGSAHRHAVEWPRRHAATASATPPRPLDADPPARMLSYCRRTIGGGRR